MIRSLFLFVIMLSFSFIIRAQPGGEWTSGNKKAVRYLEKAIRYHELQQFDDAYTMVSKAIRADSSFIEAYILLGEIAMVNENDSLAILALEYAVAIDPAFFPANLYHLGNLYIGKEDYSKALFWFNRYKSLPNKDAELLTSVEKSIKNCYFGIDAMKNPVSFRPVNLGEGVNTTLNEYYPSLTVDEELLLFTRKDEEPGNIDRFDENLYLSRFRDYLWQPSRSIGPPVNTRYNEGASAISPDGQMIIFTSCSMYGTYGQGRTGYGSCDLFYTYKTGNQWSVPQNLGTPVNTGSWESQPAFDADGKTLYFVRATPVKAGLKNADIYMTTLDVHGGWSVPRSLGSMINTPGNEEAVFIHPDGQTLYFASNGHTGLGGLDIFMSRKGPDGKWGEPVNLGYPVNTSKNETGFIVSASGKDAYFSSNRAGGYGGLDIYSFELDPFFRPVPVTYLKGVVYDAETTLPLNASFELINLKTGNVVVSSESDPVTGEFLLSLPADQTYALSVNKENYLFYSDHFELTGNYTALKPFEKDIPLQPIRKGESVVLKNIFFDFDQYVLKPESMAELRKLTELMTRNPSIKIEIGGHTDNTGTLKYNETLSTNRAKAVYDYLVSEGIESTRITYKGYADRVPIADNRTEEGRSQNRRTEFKIIEN